MSLDVEAFIAQAQAEMAALTQRADARMPLHDWRWRGNGGRTASELIARYGPPGPSMPTQLCCGAGVDTAALVTELIENPDARILLVTDEDGRERLVRLDLADVRVVMAMTGAEFDQTRAAMEDHLLPVMQKAGEREGLSFVQISRGGQSQTDGIVVLDDTATHPDPSTPWRMIMQGPWSLHDELIAAGTVPQTAAESRRCSARAKGWPLDTWAKAEYGGRERLHILGFAAEETRRVLKDQSYSAACRRSLYPLRQWGWDRSYCEDYLYARFGIEWPRSCCTYCPFTGGSAAKNALIAARWAQEPTGGALAVLLELTALALNPRMKLFKSTSARQVAEEHHLVEVLDLVESFLADTEWALYDVQRVFRPKGAKKGAHGDPTKKGKAWRSVTTVRTGSRAEMGTTLTRAREGRYEAGTTPRLWLVDRQTFYPTCEQFLVAAPTGPKDKAEDGFARLWAETIRAQGTGHLTTQRVA